jgi:hypothetical protein
VQKKQQQKKKDELVVVVVVVVVVAAVIIVIKLQNTGKFFLVFTAADVNIVGFLSCDTMLSS